jgi:hypothetical protein
MMSRILIFIFGTLPSLVLSIFAGLLIYFSVGNSSSWWAVTWGVLGIVSCAPFWALTFGRPFKCLSTKVRASYIVLLTLGLLSAAPLLFSNWIFGFFAGSAVVTGIWIVCCGAPLEKSPNHAVQRTSATPPSLT